MLSLSSLDKLGIKGALMLSLSEHDRFGTRTVRSHVTGEAPPSILSAVPVT